MCKGIAQETGQLERSIGSRVNAWVAEFLQDGMRLIHAEKCCRVFQSGKCLLLFMKLKRELIMNSGVYAIRKQRQIRDARTRCRDAKDKFPMRDRICKKGAESIEIGICHVFKGPDASIVPPLTGSRRYPICPNPEVG